MLWAEFRATRDIRLRERLIEHYLPLARTTAARIFRLRSDNTIPFADYLQYARVGLVEAVDGYDPSREATFETYSSYRIRGAVLNGLGNETEIAAQRAFWRTRMQERAESLKPSDNVSGDEELEALAGMVVGLALGFLLDQEHEQMVDETTEANPYAATALTELRKVMRGMVGKLPGRERLLVERHYFEQREFRAVAQELAVTPGRVSQLHAQALGHLRQLLQAGPDLDFNV